MLASRVLFRSAHSTKMTRSGHFGLRRHRSLKFLIDVAEDDARRAANAPRPVVFCPPLAIFGNKERATEKELIAGPTLSVECDKEPEHARLVHEQRLGPATIVVRSGGIWIDPTGGGKQAKLHLHWRLIRPATAPEQL